MVEFEIAVFRGAQPKLLYGSMTWKAKRVSKLSKILRHFIHFIETSPKEMSMQVQHYPAYMKIQYFYTGDPEEGQE